MLAYVLVSLKQASEKQVYEKLSKLKEVQELNIIFGEWDIIMKVSVRSADHLGTFVMDKIRSLPEVKLTSTLIVAK